ncbi:MAG: hypothetical protein Ct9H300mP15_10720 [Gemmatimonadota bacterium]|nr:MAG: hypothetical protein Ct9H300mP15_10720 [Gemmatimonadota bacterium]
MLEEGRTPRDALDRAMAGAPEAQRRQVGVVALDGTSAQHTETRPWLLGRP